MDFQQDFGAKCSVPRGPLLCRVFWQKVECEVHEGPLVTANLHAEDDWGWEGGNSDWHPEGDKWDSSPTGLEKASLQALGGYEGKPEDWGPD